MTCPRFGVVRLRRIPVQVLVAVLAVGLFLPLVGFSPLALAAGSSTPPVPSDAGKAHPAATPDTTRKDVLILVGGQYGLPVSDAVVTGVMAALRNKGISAKDIYVEYLDLVRNEDPGWRVELASLLRDKLARTDVGLVIAQNQAALEFLAQEGSDLVPPGVPVLATLITKPALASILFT